MLSYDVIGDVHGQADKLEALLTHMGYVRQGSGYRPPRGRQAVFLGDLIDRGPGQVRVVQIVRSMVDAGHALCIAGNHELNAIAFVTPDPLAPGQNLRPNQGSDRKPVQNRAQHAEFLAQVAEGSALHQELVGWFKTLPPFLELPGIRVAHACWSDDWVRTLSDAGWAPGRALSDELLPALYVPGSALETARRGLTAGLEMKLPPGRFIVDKSGHQHGDVRLASWRHEATTLAEVALVPKGQEEQLVGLELPADWSKTPIEGAPVFIGHHWFAGRPRIESARLAVVDWSAGTTGPLVAYRWDGEEDLNSDRFVWVGSP